MTRIVGLAALAGGLEGLEQILSFLARCRQRAGPPISLVQHLDATHQAI
jgi:chemotaxis response regulator CheB